MVAAQVIKSMNQQDDDDTYEPKSVRDLKAMFNKPSKPQVPAGQSKSRVKFNRIPYSAFNLSPDLRGVYPYIPITDGATEP